MTHLASQLVSNSLIMRAQLAKNQIPFVIKNLISDWQLPSIISLNVSPFMIELCGLFQVNQNMKKILRKEQIQKQKRRKKEEIDLRIPKREQSNYFVILLKLHFDFNTYIISIRESPRVCPQSVIKIRIWPLCTHAILLLQVYW